MQAYDVTDVNQKTAKALRQPNLEQLLARAGRTASRWRPSSGEIGPDLFRAACRMGLVGLVSKHRDRPFGGGRQKFWVKIKNRSHPEMEREL
jgi:ATP-dependent DNA ligase